MPSEFCRRGSISLIGVFICLCCVGESEGAKQMAGAAALIRWPLMNKVTKQVWYWHFVYVLMFLLFTWLGEVGKGPGIVLPPPSFRSIDQVFVSSLFWLKANYRVSVCSTIVWVHFILSCRTESRCQYTSTHVLPHLFMKCLCRVSGRCCDLLSREILI